MKKVLVSLLLVLTLVMSSVCCVSAATFGTVEWFKAQFLSTNPALNGSVEDITVPVTIKVKLNSAPATSYAASLSAAAGTLVDVIAELDMSAVKTLIGTGQATMGGNFDTVKTEDVFGQFIINAVWNSALTVSNPLATGSMTGFKFYNGDSEVLGQTIFVENGTRTTTANNATATISINSGVTVEDVVLDLPDKITLEHTGFELAASGNVTGSFDVVDYATELSAIESKTYTKIDFGGGDERYVKYIFEVTPASVSISSPSTGGGGVSGYTLTYESNGGTEYKAEVHVKGKVVELDKVPEKDGYIFDGWYADKELTKKIDSVKMTDSLTVYAAWKLDEGYEPVVVHPVPEMLNGDDHFAYINGYTDGTIRPDSNITRAEVATIFFRLLKDEVREKYLTKENVFADVNEDDWYNTAVSTMANAGVVNGRYADTFAPDEFITRAEFTAICARFDETNTMSENKFSDISFHWAEEYILEAVSYGWITGYEDYTFRPDAFITRAETVTLINRVTNRNPKTVDALLDDMKVWTDNSNENAWYYIAIQEAANSHEYAREDGADETWTQLTENRDWTVYEK